MIRFIGKRLPNDKSRGVYEPDGDDSGPQVFRVESEAELPERFRRRAILDKESEAINTGCYEIPF